MRAAVTLAVMLGAGIHPAMAQEADPPAIVVTGAGLAPPEGDGAYDVIRIDRDRLAAALRLEDVLGDVAGLAEFRRSDSRSAHPTSQGVTLRGLGGNASSRALVLLDGVPQGDPFAGWIAFPALMPGRLSSVRITRGGGSGYQGPGALAGTIELTSAGPDALGPVQARAAYGSRNALDLSAVGAVPLGDGFASYAAGYARGDGFVPIVDADRGPVDRAAPYEQASLALRGVAPIDGGTELQASLGAFTDRRDRGTAYSRNLNQGADASLRLVGSGRWRWSALGYVQARSFASGFASVNATRSTVSPALDQFNVPSTAVGGRLELSPPLGDRLSLHLGGDVRAVDGATHEAYLFQNGTATRQRVAGGRTATAGLFADAAWTTGAVTLNLGGRVDHWAIADGSLVERTTAGAVLTDTAYPNRDGWEATGRAGIAWRAASALTLRAAAYRGWRLPTLNELYRPFRVGSDATAANAALNPERLTGAEIGLDLRPAPRLQFSVTGYANRITDAIGNVTLGTGPGNFPGIGFVAAGGTYRQRRNLNAIRSRGVEADFSWRAGQWSLAASYAFTDARVAASGAAAALDGKRPAQTPLHQAAATLGWADGARAAGLTLRYQGARFEDDLATRRLEDALTLDARLAWPLTHALSMEARAENLFDARVEAGINGDGAVEHAAPRTLWIGFSFRPWRSGRSR